MEDKIFGFATKTEFLSMFSCVINIFFPPYVSPTLFYVFPILIC